MNKSSKLVLIILIGAVLIGAYTFASSWTKDQTIEPDVYAQTSGADTELTQKQGDVATTSTSTTTTITPSSSTLTQNLTTTTSTSTDGCVRTVDRSIYAKTPYDIKNKTVSFTVKDFGQVNIKLYDSEAPKTVENFLKLVESGYYDCLIVHRVSKGFVIQTGDPTGTGRGGDSSFGSTFADEINPNSSIYKTGYIQGVVAMANRGPNTNTSQFFILLGDASKMLGPDYTIFGKVTSGQDVVDKIGKVDIIPNSTPTDGKPVKDVVISKAVIN